MRLACLLILTTLLSFYSNAEDLRYGSHRCTELKTSGNFNPYNCYDHFFLQAPTEVDSLEETSGKISVQLQKVGTLKNLSTILKSKFLNNLQMNYQQNLIIAQNLGADVGKLKEKIQLAGKSCGTEGAQIIQDKFIMIHDKITKIHNEKENELHKKKYLKQLYSAFIEANRLKTLLKQYKRSAPDKVEIIQSINKDLQNLYRFYPILGNVMASGLNGGNISKLFLSRVLVKNPRPENALAHAYETSEDINNILKIPPGFELQTSYPKVNKVTHRRNPYLYKAMHHQISKDDFRDAMYEGRVPKWAEEAALNNINSIGKVCDSSPCDIFKMVPHEIGDMIATVKDERTKKALQTSICQCEIGFTEDTFSPLIHLGLVAGMIGAGVGCIAFPPACIAAVVIGGTSTTLGLMDYNTVSENNDRIIEQAITNSSVSDYNKYFLDQIQTLDDSNSEMFMSNIFLPLEFLGAAGDIAAVAKGTSKLIAGFKAVENSEEATTAVNLERRSEDAASNGNIKREGPRRHDSDQREFLDNLEADLGPRKESLLQKYNPGNVHKLSNGDNIYLAGLAEVLEDGIKLPKGFHRLDKFSQDKILEFKKAEIKKTIDDVIKQCKGKVK